MQFLIKNLLYSTMFHPLCKRRYFSINSSASYDDLSIGITPNNGNNFKLFFENVKVSKREIYKKLKDKSGVYLFLNKQTSEMYIGSSVQLSKRMAIHFYNAKSSQETTIIFYRAMRKYGLENFDLAILEFCESNETDCSKLEQFWIDYYQPKYNILKEARSSRGFKHSIETINKLKKMFYKENHPKFGTINSTETRKAISDSLKEFYKTNSSPFKGVKGELSPQYGLNGTSVFIYSESGKELIFPSINGAKNHFKVR